MDDRSPESPRRKLAQVGRPAAAGRAEFASPASDSAAYREDHSARVRYRCELRRHADPEPRQIYYDGGDYSPYCLDSLADLLRREAMLPHSALEILIDLTGPCPGSLLREMTLRFSSLGIARLHIRIRAEGHLPIDSGAKNAAPEAASETAAARHRPSGA